MSTKFFASLFVALGLVAFAPAAYADPVTGCAVTSQDAGGNDLLTCDVVDIDTAETVVVTDPFPPPDWFNGFVRLFENDGSGSLSDIIQFRANDGGVATMTLYSDTGGQAFTDAAAAAATAFTDFPATVLDLIENNFPTTFYVSWQGAINPGGASTGIFDGCGASATGSCDTINVYSDVEVSGVPEPATLTLMGIGGVMAAIRRRRKATV